MRPFASRINRNQAVYTVTAPGGFIVTPANATCALSWSTSARTSGYRVYVNSALVASLPASASSYTATGLTNELAHAFRVSAFNINNVESLTAPLIAVPQAVGSTVRNAVLYPFDSASLWNLGMDSGATFETSVATKTAAFIATAQPGSGQNYYLLTMYSQYYQPITLAQSTDPTAQITDSGASRDGSPSTVSTPVPVDAEIAVGTDQHMGIVNPARTFIAENWNTTRASSVLYNVGRYHNVDLKGSGMGPMNGVRAYGGSMIAGKIREWEVKQGRIDHMLSMVVPWTMLYFNPTNSVYGYATGGTTTAADQPGWPVGTAKAGFGTSLGYTWPATEQDYNAQGNYAGPIPMGSVFAIPPAVDVTALGLNAAGVIVARAMQDYGAMIVDTNGGSNGVNMIQVDNTAATATFITQIDDYGATLNVIRQQMRLVTNNLITTPKGGLPASGTRRRTAPVALI